MSSDADIPQCIWCWQDNSEKQFSRFHLVQKELMVGSLAWRTAGSLFCLCLPSWGMSIRLQVGFYIGSRDPIHVTRFDSWYFYTSVPPHPPPRVLLKYSFSLACIFLWTPEMTGQHLQLSFWKSTLLDHPKQEAHFLLSKTLNHNNHHIPLCFRGLSSICFTFSGAAPVASSKGL